jgi:ubiquinone/menaquinone biosynthesis C-methylase UbiE
MAIISQEDNGLAYPDYYLNEFHAYDAGNLEWKAAMECESATMSMALRVWPKDGLTAEEAQNRLRYSYIDAAKKYAPALVTADAPKILDIGCSVGMSTFYLQDGFPQASLTGLDLSPYFLAVAQHRADTSSDGKYKSIEWKHGLAEDSKLKAASFDMVTASYLFHELTDAAATAIIAEMFRVVKPGGTVAITDNNPKSPVIQNLPAPIFTLMKSTEPWSDQYYVFNIEAALSRAGFTNVHTTDTDPRHRGIFATKPLKS